MCPCDISLFIRTSGISGFSPQSTSPNSSTGSQLRDQPSSQLAGSGLHTPPLNEFSDSLQSSPNSPTSSQSNRSPCHKGRAPERNFSNQEVFISNSNSEKPDIKPFSLLQDAGQIKLSTSSTSYSTQSHTYSNCSNDSSPSISCPASSFYSYSQTNSTPTQTSSKYVSDSSYSSPSVETSSSYYSNNQNLHNQSSLFHESQNSSKPMHNYHYNQINQKPDNLHFSNKNANSNMNSNIPLDNTQVLMAPSLSPMKMNTSCNSSFTLLPNSSHAHTCHFQTILDSPFPIFTSIPQIEGRFANYFGPIVFIYNL